MWLQQRNDDYGFDHRVHRRGASKCCLLPISELVATVALAISTAVAVTVVSIEIAQAETFGPVGGVEGSGIALATFLGLLITVMGGIAAAVTRRHSSRR